MFAALARRVGERRRVCKAGASQRGGKAGNKHENAEPLGEGSAGVPVELMVRLRSSSRL
jgi:hypothetical protein